MRDTVHQNCDTAGLAYSPGGEHGSKRSGAKVCEHPTKKKEIPSTKIGDTRRTIGSENERLPSEPSPFGRFAKGFMTRYRNHKPPIRHLGFH